MCAFPPSPKMMMTMLNFFQPSFGLCFGLFWVGMYELKSLESTIIIGSELTDAFLLVCDYNCCWCSSLVKYYNVILLQMMHEMIH